MTAISRRLQRVLAPIILLVVLATTTFASTPAVRATPTPEWAAWSVEVTFPNGNLQAIYTAYIGTNNPPTIIDYRQRDITPRCVNNGVTYGNGYADFNGKSYIACQTPDLRAVVQDIDPNFAAGLCTGCPVMPGDAPFFVAADVNLDPAKTGSNPIFDLERQSVVMDLQAIGAGDAETVVTIQGNAYSSPPWALNSNGSNRMLMGLDGPIIREGASSFGWLSFLTDPTWETEFDNNVLGNTMGHWDDTAGAFSTNTASPYYSDTGSDVLYIGHSPRSNTYLRGRLYEAIFDPPGCPGY